MKINMVWMYAFINEQVKITAWDKMKLMETSIFSLAYNVFKRLSEVDLYLTRSIPNNQILHWSKLKAFADNNLRFAKITISVWDSGEKIVGKGENAGYQHFLLFPQCFQKASIWGSLKVGIVW